MDDSFDTSYSLCVINHVTDWNNYISEKMRCLKKGGRLQERMPNAKNWDFWQHMEVLYEGMEKKAKLCHIGSAYNILGKLGIIGHAWTHDRQPDIDCFGKIPKIRSRLTKLSKMIYNYKTNKEDKKYSPNNLMRNTLIDDHKGIYTVINVKK